MSRERMKNHTKELLKKSLLELLDKKNLSKITIKELCEQVDINRTTYYHYYLDQYDQLEKIEQEIFCNMSDYVELVNEENMKDKEKQLQIITRVLSYIEDNKIEFKILLEKSDINFQTKMLSFIGKKLFSNINDKSKSSEIKYIYTANGSFGIVSEWIKGNLELTVNELAEIITKLNAK